MSSMSKFMMSSRVNRIALVAGLLLLGCGSSGGGGGNGAPFVGMWKYSSGTVTPMNCSILGTPIPALDLAGDTVTISMGTDSSHLQFVEGMACTINFSVSGSIATASAAQMCTIPVMGVNAVINVSAWTLTLTGDTISTNFSGSAPIGGANCTASGSGTLQRNSTDGAAGG